MGEDVGAGVLGVDIVYRKRGGKGIGLMRIVGWRREGFGIIRACSIYHVLHGADREICLAKVRTRPLTLARQNLAGAWPYPPIFFKLEIPNPLCSDANYHQQSLWCHPGDW